MRNMRDPSLKTIIAMPTLVMSLAVVLAATQVPIITAIAQNTRKIITATTLGKVGENSTLTSCLLPRTII
jgi:hypothetical protein